ncbi:hypothetical protein AGOR_G00108880 [Albula goreensis]|uniref:Protein GREB1 n=1 Tax=Albula goreensis TaxID=1534307 RepID=A0A8T3DIL9_9TELE|nr:hypothetical protein AGOR_G00108880 [Albula goreensis]
MGNSYAGQLKTTRFEEVLHSSIEASLRSNSVVPRPVFSQLYLEAEQPPPTHEACRPENEDEDEEESSESNSPPIPYQMKPPPEGCCTTDGFCQAGKDLRLASIASDRLDVPLGFLLVGAKSPSLPDHILVCAVDHKFLPDESGRNALLGFSGNCIGCGEKGFRYFTEFSNHINLKLATQPKKQKHLKYCLLRNAQGVLVKGPLICWKGTESRARQIAPKTCGSHPTPEEHLPTIVATEMLSAAGHNGPMADSYTAVVPVDPPAPAPPPLINGRECHLSQQPLQQPNSGAAGPGRPTVIGTKANTGPPKKRHKGWSPESPVTSEPSAKMTCPASTNGTKTDNGAPVCGPQGTSPQLPAGECATVPDNLLSTCRLQPVIYKGHGTLPHLSGNVSEVMVSSLLQACYHSCQALPRVYEQHGATPIQPLSTEMQILLTVYYLVQLASDQVPLMEDLEQIFMRSWRESHLTEIRQYQQPHPQVPSHLSGPAQPVTAAQLPWLAKMAASSCGEGVLVLDAISSLAEGLEDTFRRLMDGKLTQTNYVVIICTAKSQNTESCVVVTGKHQARAVAESVLSPSDCLREVGLQLAPGKERELGSLISSLGQDVNVDVLLEKCSVEKNSHSFLSSSLESSGDSPRATCAEYRAAWHELRPVQLAVARKLLSHVCAIADSSTQNLDLGSFDKVEFLISVPPSEVTFQQVVTHLWNSGVLRELGLDKECTTQKEAEQYVVKLDQWAQSKISTLIQKSKMNPYTLFILVHDHAHWDLSSGSYSGGDFCSGMVDNMLNCPEIRDAANILTLHVTSFPFALQTQNTRISPYNEIHWPSPFNNDVDLYREKTRYFGISEFLDSTRSGCGMPLLRYDSSFENMANTLGER